MGLFKHRWSLEAHTGDMRLQRLKCATTVKKSFVLNYHSARLENQIILFKLGIAEVIFWALNCVALETA